MGRYRELLYIKKKEIEHWISNLSTIELSYVKLIKWVLFTTSSRSNRIIYIENIQFLEMRIEQCIFKWKIGKCHFCNVYGKVCITYVIQFTLLLCFIVIKRKISSHYLHDDKLVSINFGKKYFILKILSLIWSCLKSMPFDTKLKHDVEHSKYEINDNCRKRSKKPFKKKIKII